MGKSPFPFQLDAYLTIPRNPDGGSLPQLNAFTFIVNGIKFGGSCIGSPADIREMLELASKKQLKPLIEERPMEDANDVLVDMGKGLARYRYVLVNSRNL